MIDELKPVLELCIGLVMLVIGVLVDWWSRQLVWIEIYPPPLAKQIIGLLPTLFWIVSIILLVDGMRRLLSEKSNR